MIYHLKNLIEIASSCAVYINGQWVPGRPFVGFGIIYRIKAAWLVITKRADVVIWPEGQ